MDTVPAYVDWRAGIWLLRWAGLADYKVHLKLMDKGLPCHMILVRSGRETSTAYKPCLPGTDTVQVEQYSTLPLVYLFCLYVKLVFLLTLNRCYVGGPSPHAPYIGYPLRLRHNKGLILNNHGRKRVNSEDWQRGVYSVKTDEEGLSLKYW
jgi:hypothetical protein